MSNNVGGNDGNQVNIKLFNGKTINLKKLDKLVGQRVEGSVFAWADTKARGGNDNQIFDANEIKAIRDALIAQSQDGEVSQEELNLIFASGETEEEKKNFDVNRLTSTMDSIPEDSEEAPPPPPSNKPEESPISETSEESTQVSASSQPVQETPPLNRTLKPLFIQIMLFNPAIRRRKLLRNWA